MKFTKPPVSIAGQIELLARRGMLVADVAHAAHYLQHISYYRLRAYWLPFEETAASGDHQFKAGTSFDDVLTLYVFDGNPSKDITLNFARGDGSGSFMVQGGINSGIGGVMPAWGAISTTQFLNTQVDNRNYSYTVYAIVPPQSWLDLGFSNVRIDYEYATAIPILSK